MNDAASPRGVHDELIPKERYTSPAFARDEMQKMWSRVWQIAAREEDVATPGDHVVYTIGDDSLLVVRGDDHVVRAFHNTCLHRGTRLASGPGCFETSQIRCRYHAWTYALDGALVAVPDREEFPDLPTDAALHEARCDTWGGFVFVNLDRQAEPLLTYLDPIPDLLGPYHLDQMRLRAAISTELPANWKVVLDAFNEAYHVQGTHAQILPWTDDTTIEYEQIGRHSRYGRLAGARRTLAPSVRLGEAGPVDEGAILAGMVDGLGGAFLAEERALVDELRAADLPPGELLPSYQARRRDLLASRGVDVSALPADAMTSAEDFFWFPNVVGPIYPGSAILFRVRPLGLDPGRSIKDTWVLQWPDPSRPEREPRRETLADWTDRDWGEITNQDYANMAEVQAGMRSSGFRGLRLARHQESNLAHFHRVLDDYLAESAR